MTIAMRGLKVKPTYKDLIGVAYSDGLKRNSIIVMPLF